MARPTTGPIARKLRAEIKRISNEIAELNLLADKLLEGISEDAQTEMGQPLKRPNGRLTDFGIDRIYLAFSIRQDHKEIAKQFGLSLSAVAKRAEMWRRGQQ